MSRCLCCGKTLRTENEYGWHTSCIKSFFGTSKFPDIDVSEEILNQLAIDSTTKGYTVPGVQKKLSLHLTTGTEPRLTLVNYPTGYILKPQTAEYSALPEMEYLVMPLVITNYQKLYYQFPYQRKNQTKTKSHSLPYKQPYRKIWHVMDDIL